jgi:cytidine deaminase
MDTPQLESATAARLMTAAREAATRAYVPYSDFPVGAALLCANGEIVTGCNVENASYGLTCCAERTAVFTAVAAGHRELIAVAVTAPKVPTVTPCGACRQVLFEFNPRDHEMVVILDGPDGLAQLRLAELLPRAFGPRALDEASGSGA